MPTHAMRRCFTIQRQIGRHASRPTRDCKRSCSATTSSARPDGKHTLVLSNGVVGAEKQAIALAEAIGLPYTVQRVPSPSFSLPTRLILAMSRAETPPPPFPTVAISCGRTTIPASIALRAASSSTLTVHIQRPDIAESHFDLVIAPRHDYADGATTVPENVHLTDGSLHNVSPSSLSTARDEWSKELSSLPSPRLAMLIGGAVSRRWWQRPLAPELTADSLVALVDSAAKAVKAAGGSLLLATSRRTPADACDAAEAALGKADVPSRVWSADASPNPYLGLLAWSDYLLVTPDSINMVSEACGSGKPVYVASPRDCRRRFLSFHERLLEKGRTREWNGELEALWNRTETESEVSAAAARVRGCVDA